jgi:hypothetical protein
MSDEEILRLLNISTESTFYKKIVRILKNKSVIFSLVYLIRNQIVK